MFIYFLHALSMLVIFIFIHYIKSYQLNNCIISGIFMIKNIHQYLEPTMFSIYSIIKFGLVSFVMIMNTQKRVCSCSKGVCYNNIFFFNLNNNNCSSVYMGSMKIVQFYDLTISLFTYNYFYFLKDCYG